MKRTEELKKIKKVNDTLKRLLKPLKLNRRNTRHSGPSDRGTDNKKETEPLLSR